MKASESVTSAVPWGAASASAAGRTYPLLWPSAPGLSHRVGEIVDGRRKAELLRLLCQAENINIAQSIAVGDGANDLPMLDLAGLGIAFHAKPKVKATASQSISTIGLDGVLYFLGLKDSWIE